MSKKKKCPECPAGEKWAVPYADFLSLLLALFIALWAISQTDASKAAAVKEAFIQIFDFPDNKSTRENQSATNSVKNLENQGYSMQQSQAIRENRNNERYNIALDQAENQIVIDLPSFVQFSNGSSAIDKEETKVFLRTISMIIDKLPNSVDIEVRGWADDSDDYIENYRLSAARSFAVLAYLLSNGADAKRMQFSAYANNFNGQNLAKSLKIAKVYFRIDREDIKTQHSVLDLLQREQRKLQEENSQ